MNISVKAALLSVVLGSGSGLCLQLSPTYDNPLAACGDDKDHFTVSAINSHISPPAAKTGKANIYFIEVYDLSDKGRFAKPTIRHGIDGAWVGATKGSMYTMWSVEPGVHHLCSRWQGGTANGLDGTSLNQLEAVEGHDYYFRVRISVETTGYQVGPSLLVLEALPVDEGQYLVSKLSQSSSNRKQ